MTEQQAPPKDHSLSFRNHCTHFLLLHDFLYKITKTKANNSQFLDLQIDVTQSMRTAVGRGSKAAQFFAFGSLSLYFFRGHSILMKMFTGFLFMYWFNHTMTLGSYAGAFAIIPSLYKKVSIYYDNHPEQLNVVNKLNRFMNQSDSCEQPDLLLPQIFQQTFEDKQYIVNDFFVKNRDKYFPKGSLDRPYQSLKLPYFDSFLTRYIYYSFIRWTQKVGDLFTSAEDDD